MCEANVQNGTPTVSLRAQFTKICTTWCAKKGRSLMKTKTCIHSYLTESQRSLKTLLAHFELPQGFISLLAIHVRTPYFSMYFEALGSIGAPLGPQGGEEVAGRAPRGGTNNFSLGIAIVLGLQIV